MPVFAVCTQQIVPGPDVGTVVVSTHPRSLGQITFASPVACNVFGYSRMQLESMTLDALIPEPIAAVQ